LVVVVFGDGIPSVNLAHFDYLVFSSTRESRGIFEERDVVVVLSRIAAPRVDGSHWKSNVGYWISVIS
jgi:hypothetical protein